MQLVTIDKNQAGQRFDKFLHKYLPEAGTSFLYKMMRKKNITLNGKKAEGKEILAVGDEVRFFFAEETFLKFSGQVALGESDTCSEYQKAFEMLSGIAVIYEDENVLFLNKPAGILTQKAKEDDMSLNEWMIGYLLSNGSITKETLHTFHPSVCNRLDRNTSGLVLCGKSLAGSQELSRLIKDRSLQKFYQTICVGKLDKGADLKGYLVKNHKTNKVTVVNKNNKHYDSTGAVIKSNKIEGEYIHTKYKPLSFTKDYTLLEVELITGKTHQIRSHLASTGHPIIGDFKYGDRAVNMQFKEKFGLQYQLLHAYRVVFTELEGTLEDLSEKEFIAPCTELFEEIRKGVNL